MSIRYPSGRITLSINPLLVPDAPATATATTSTATTASVAFTAPSNVGGGAVTSYSVVPTTGGTVVSTASSPASITGLSPSTSYTFQVTALNSYGPGPIITSNSITTGALSWLGSLVFSGGSSADGAGITSDSSGNVYVVGSCNFPAYYLGATLKLNSAGAIQWQKFFRQTGNGTFCQLNDTIVDSSGNVYVCGYEDGNSIWLLAKYDSSGTLQWQNKFSALGNNDVAVSMKFDSSGNIVICGRAYNTGFAILKIDTSGSLLWQVKLGATTTTYGRGVAIDSSDNIYVSGYSDVPSGTGTQDFVVAKYNSSGTLQWQRYLGGGGLQYQYGKGIAVDSSANVYICGWSNDTGTALGILAKWNTSGTFQWQRQFGNSGGGSQVFNDIAIDSSDNIYAVGYASVNGIIVKYDSTGAVTWQRRIYDNSGGGYSTQFQCVSLRGTTLYVNGFKGQSGGNAFLIAQIPTDGSLTGTYTLNGLSVTYTASTYTTGTSSLTAGTSSLTAAAGTGTYATSTAVPTVATLVAYNVTI